MKERGEGASLYIGDALSAHFGALSYSSPPPP